MRVLIDDQVFVRQRVGGISRYFTELAQAFRTDERYGIELTQGPIWTHNEHLLGAGLGLGRRLPGPVGGRQRPLALANRLTRSRPATDVVHHTFYDRQALARHRGEVSVTTVYDMIPELFPELFPGGNPHLAKEDYVRSADLVLCISEATRRDLFEVYGQLSAPVVVTPLGVDPRFRPNVPRLAALPDRYVLFVGGRGSYKDFPVLAKAFASAFSASEDVWLVVVGSVPLRDEEEMLLDSLGIRNRTQQLSLSERELASAYSCALCFAFPSRYEGFGLPTLEAMASGCPVVLAGTSSHLEVGGDAAEYFSPGDDAALSSVLRRYADDAVLRETRRAAGLERADRFPWSATAAGTAAAYRGLFASRTGSSAAAVAALRA